MRSLILLLCAITFINCAQDQQSTPVAKTLSQQVDAFIQADEYTDALTLLAQQEDSEEVAMLKEKTYLNYGLFLEYRDSDTTNMRDKMNGALNQYIEVLKINKDNEKAVSEIEQILGIYSTFPDRQPEESVLADLKELGFNI